MSASSRMPSSSAPAELADAGLVELRQYTLKPGMRNTLLDVFETHLIDGQEAVGMRIGGIYRDDEDPDRFVWMRGFHTLEQRRQALTAFYFGPVWRLHSATANSTMIDSDDVLMLRSTSPPHSPAPAGHRLPRHRAVASEHRVRLSVYAYEPDDGLTSWLSTTVHSALERHLQCAVATWRTDPRPNTFPQLPVRDANAFVWSATFRDAGTALDAQARLESAPEWQAAIAPRLRASVVEQRLHLRPTGCSQHPQPVPSMTAAFT